MTREEALQRVEGYLTDSFPPEEFDEVEEIMKTLKQEPVLDKIRAEIEQIEINGHIRDVECFRAGINAALNIINKYKAEGEE